MTRRALPLKASLKLATAAMLLTALCTPAAALAAGDANQTSNVGPLGQFKIQIKERNGEFHNRLLIRRGHRVLLDQSAYNIALVDPASGEPNLGFTGRGKLKLFDLTGDGVDEIIIRQWSGGAHCCYTYDIYSLDARLSHIGHFALGDGHMLTMLSTKKRQMLILEDSSFRYWRSNVYEFPKVPLTWRNHVFVADKTMMKNLNALKLDNKLLQELRQNSGENKSEPLYRTLIQLYYSGRASEGRKLIQRLHGNDETAAALHKDFVDQLKRSQFFKAILSLNSSVL